MTPLASAFSLLLLTCGTASAGPALWSGPDAPLPDIPDVSAPSRASDAGLLDAVTESSTGKTVLSADSCAALAKQLRALSDWKRAAGEIVPAAPAVFSDGGRCSAEVQDYLPARPRRVNGKKTFRNGPNCWNNVLFTGNMAQAPRFSAAGEMTFWMDSPYCRQLGIRETPRPGDIVAMRTSARKGSRAGAPPEEMHGMVFLSPELVFSKNTSSKNDPYHMQRAPLVYQTFHFVSEQCEFVEGTPETCSTWANYYRCSDPAADRQAAYASSPGLAETARKFRLLEDRLSFAVMAGGGPDEEITPLLKEVEALTAETENSAAAPTGQKEEFFSGALLEAMRSARAQIRTGWKL